MPQFRSRRPKLSPEHGRSSPRSLWRSACCPSTDKTWCSSERQKGHLRRRAAALGCGIEALEQPDDIRRAFRALLTQHVNLIGLQDGNGQRQTRPVPTAARIAHDLRKNPQERLGDGGVLLAKLLDLMRAIACDDALLRKKESSARPAHAP